MRELRSKSIIKTKDGKQLTIYDGYYKDGVFYGNSHNGKEEKSVPVGNIKSKKLTWVY